MAKEDKDSETITEILSSWNLMVAAEVMRSVRSLD